MLKSFERIASTRANSWLGLVADSGISIFLLYAGLRLGGYPAVSALSAVLAGLFVFSFVEYCFHRWLFHGVTPSFAQGHRLHHDEPLGYDALPFFLPPMAILALAELLGLAGPKALAMLFAGGFAAGYAAYGTSHTLIHRMRFRSALLRRWAAAHHIHHRHPRSNFGVTSPLWDVIMGTRYLRREGEA